MDSIKYVTTPAKEVNRIITKMKDVFGEEDLDLMLIACITISITSRLHSNVDPDALANAIKSTSEFTALVADSLENPVTDPKEIN